MPYVICVEVGADGRPAAGAASGKGLAQRAHHPDEIRASDGRLALDVEYYLAQQVWPHAYQHARKLNSPREQGHHSD